MFRTSRDRIPLKSSSWCIHTDKAHDRNTETPGRRLQWRPPAARHVICNASAAPPRRPSRRLRPLDVFTRIGYAHFKSARMGDAAHRHAPSTPIARTANGLARSTSRHLFSVTSAPLTYWAGVSNAATAGAYAGIGLPNAARSTIPLSRTIQGRLKWTRGHPELERMERRGNRSNAVQRNRNEQEVNRNNTIKQRDQQNVNRN